VLTVADTGCGMSPETLSRIFEPFFSTKGATGTGLGLWVSLEIVEKHGGSLRVRSRLASGAEPGGSVFRFFVPSTSA
jgi:signal transduction histidine kinase